MKTPRLDDQLCFALYSASRLIIRTYKPVLMELGLTYPQYLVMMVLWEWDDAGANAHSVRELGDKLHLDSGTLTPLLKRLADRELVYRKRSETDERVVCVGVSQTGRELASRAHEVPYSLACYFQGGDLERLVSMRSNVQRIVERLAEGVPEGP